MGKPVTLKKSLDFPGSWFWIWRTLGQHSAPHAFLGPKCNVALGLCVGSAARGLMADPDSAVAS